MPHHHLVGAPAPGLAAPKRPLVVPDVTTPGGNRASKDQESGQRNSAMVQAALAGCTCLRCVGDRLRQIGGQV